MVSFVPYILPIYLPMLILWLLLFLLTNLFTFIKKPENFTKDYCIQYYFIFKKTI